MHLTILKVADFYLIFAVAIPLGAHRATLQPQERRAKLHRAHLTILGTKTIIIDQRKFQKTSRSSNVIFSSNGVVFCVFASCWIESKINYDKKDRFFCKHFLMIFFVLNCFIPYTIHKNIHYTYKMFLYDSKYFCNSQNLENISL